MTKETLDGENIFVIHDFLAPHECEDYVALSESGGYEDATITTPMGFVMRKDIRDNARYILDDTALAAKIWVRAGAFMPRTFRHRTAVGLNERFRFYRYDPGQMFAKHRDGNFERDNGEESQFTFMVYLNDGFAGGETKFHVSTGMPWLDVVPRRGMALVFEHRLLHEGAPVLSGRKYVMRTDVMYL